MKIIISFLFLSVLLSSVYGQLVPPTVVKSIPILEIVDKDLEAILDTIIATEKLRDYYGSKTEFVLCAYPSDVSSSFLKDLHITTRGQPYERGECYGAFEYKGEKIFVVNFFSDRLLKKTGKYMKKAFTTEGMWTNEKTGKKEVVINILDDRRSAWIYSYNDEGKLTLLKFSNTDGRR